MDQNREPRQDSTSRKRGRALALTILGIIVVVAISSVAADLLRSRSLRIDPTDRPIEVDADGYVSSDNCRSCHPAEYHSWYNSYHRTMTQPANPDTVKGDFNDVALELDGIQYRMQREGDRFYLKIVGEASRHEIVMVTGSHHMQVYWYSTGEQRLLSQNPFTYYMGVGWVPFRSVFVRPPEEHRPVLVQHYGTGRWNDTCLNCHTTHGRPRMGFDGTFDTEVAEFGIACESCHGPSEEHIRVNRSPLRRYAQYFEEITQRACEETGVGGVRPLPRNLPVSRCRRRAVLEKIRFRLPAGGHSRERPVSVPAEPGRRGTNGRPDREKRQGAGSELLLGGWQGPFIGTRVQRHD
jgi:hypothetical protein